MSTIPSASRNIPTSYKLIPALWRVTRDNEFLEDLSEFIVSGRVSFNPDRSIKWQFEAEIDQAARIKPYVDFISPRLTIEHEDGSSETSSYGVYLTVPPKKSISNTEQFITLDSRDLTYILANDGFDDGYTRSAGQNIVQTVRALLEEAGFSRHQIADHPALLEDTKSWGANTSRLEVINELLNSINFYTLYMTKDGYVASRPYVGDRDKAASISYSTNPPSKVQVVSSPIKHETTPDRIANRIIVIGGTPPDNVIIGRAINNSPSSPTSTVNLGMTITKKYEGVQVADQESANLIAQQYLDIASQEYNRLNIKTFPDLSVGPYDVYRLDIRNTVGEAVAEGTWNQRGFEVSFTTPDGNGLMTHELSNIDDPAMNMEGGA